MTTFCLYRNVSTFENQTLSVLKTKFYLGPAKQRYSEYKENHSIVGENITLCRLLYFHIRKFSWDSKERVVWTLKVLWDLCTNKKKFYKKSNRYRIYLPRQYGFKSEIICTYPITFFHLTEANYWHCVIRLCHKIMTKVVEIMMPRGTYIFWDIYILRYKYSEIYIYSEI